MRKYYRYSLSLQATMLCDLHDLGLICQPKQAWMCCERSQASTWPQKEATSALVV